ncbi:ASPIC/UnbV domain protein [Acidisarcina polymorpha]|uniref:ASPIC/UnbV domain protein n=1 Tax=Acidisarcina polymorpha TaxID=2211140 RepID=A0A2Z5G466_9BACT|nr:CRTAC1 family protein [Acidisarcina polymorpha]AXC13898.1 ASPIC/UnbV domain protein [Acidisarcina polymorpha]
MSGQQSVGGGWFLDVAPRSTFSYKTNNDYTGRKYFPQPMCGGVAIFDYDNDGRMDIFLTNGAKLPELQKVGTTYDNALLRNNGDGTFEDVTVKAGLKGAETGYSFGVAAGDYDNDGREDLFVASAGRNTLYHNNGDGTFSDVTANSGLDDKKAGLLSVGAAWFDFDNDGLLDLIVSNYTLWDPHLDKPCFRVASGDTAEAKAGSKIVESYCSPRDVVSVSPSLYRNLGNGHFENVTETSGIGSVLGKGMGISIADFNGDGLMDIFMANDTERNFLFINQGGGKFREQALLYGVAYNEGGSSVSGMGSDAKDYDNDGLPDVAYNDLAGQIFGLFKNNQGHYFDDSARKSNIENLSRPIAGWSMGFIDYDNDGWKDIYSANGDVDNLGPNAKQHDSMFRNLNGKYFVDATTEMGQDFLFTGFQRGAAFGDLNNDGYPDIVVTSLGQKPRILINRALSGNHWLLFDLRGTISNRDAIGAQVKVTTAAGQKLFNHVATSVGFMSSSDRRVPFGLGKETSASSVEIRWPSGLVQKLGPTAADQIVKVIEPMPEGKPHP